MHADPEGERFRYSVFISYSHKDAAWAKWLHNGLETYVVPPSLRSAPAVNPATGRLWPVFRDRDELPGAASLSDAVTAALRESRFLVVICSPNSAGSFYVNSEIERFRSLGRTSQVLAIIVDGEPNVPVGDPRQCFPAALREGEADIEPLAADARPTGDGKRFATLKLLAAVLGSNLGELHKRDEIRRRRLLMQRLAGYGLLAFFLALTFVLSSDAGMEIPGGESVRLWVDRHNWSVLRPVPEENATRLTATEVRKKYIQIIDESLLPEGRFPWDVRGADTHGDTWTSAQALAAFCSAPETPASQSSRLLKTYRRMFEPDIFLHDENGPTGWEQRRGSPSRGAIAMWMTAALALAIERRDLFDVSQREELTDLLAQATGVAEMYAAKDRGGWNMFPQLQRGRADCYTSALALQALLKLERGDLPWQGDRALRRAHLEETLRWLIAAYDRELTTPGWGKYPRDRHQTFDGLTLQVHAVLLEAENQGIGELPNELVQNAILQIEQCAYRDGSFPLTTAEFDATVLYKGEIRDENEGITFVWHPWAIKASAELLRRHQRIPLSPEHLTRVRRSLARMVELAQSPGSVGEKKLFSMAETLLGLASVSEPPANSTVRTVVSD